MLNIVKGRDTFYPAGSNYCLNVGHMRIKGSINGRESVGIPLID